MYYILIYTPHTHFIIFLKAKAIFFLFFVAWIQQKEFPDMTLKGWMKAGTVMTSRRTRAHALPQRSLGSNMLSRVPAASLMGYMPAITDERRRGSSG